MWYKHDEWGLWIWHPDDFVFYPALSFFTLNNNIIMEDGGIQSEKLLTLIGIASIVIYENNASEKLISDFKKITDNIPVIGIFSFKQNKYSKPYTGGFEYLLQLANNAHNSDLSNPLSAPFKFNMDWSIMISPNIGIDGKYIDRAFAFNIGIPMQNISTPNIFFDNIIYPPVKNISPYQSSSPSIMQKKIKWSWPRHILSIEQKNKLFQFTDETPFSSFLYLNTQHIIIISGAPLSGKTILARRISAYLNNQAQICKDIPIHLLPPHSQNHSTIFTNSFPNISDKQKLLRWLASHSFDVKLIWIDIQLPLSLNNLFRHLRVQLCKSLPINTTNHTTNHNTNHTNNIPPAELSPINSINLFHKLYQPLNPPPNIHYIKFPIVLKKIPELYYVY